MWFIDNGALKENNTRVLQHLGLNNETAYFELHGGDRVLLKLNKLVDSGDNQTPMKLQSLSDNYSFGYLNNTYNGDVYKKSGQMGFPPSFLGTEVDYTVVKN